VTTTTTTTTAAAASVYVCGESSQLNVFSQFNIIIRSTGTVRTSAKAHLTSVATRIRIRDPDGDQNLGLIICSLAHCQPSMQTKRKTKGPKFTVLWEHVEEILLLNKFFSDCPYVP